MKICGVICELNPFHFGHEYLFQKARRLTGADMIIAVMSGDFVQRGIPAVCDKYDRCKMALMGGADLVIELPAVYATASADYFAMGAVSALESMKCVDYICFGSECGDISILNRYVSRLLGKSDEINIIGYSREGMSYTKALGEELGDSLGSNDILACCYLKAMKLLASDMRAVTIKRVGSDYLDESSKSASASGIRRKIHESGIYIKEDYSDLLPEYVISILEEAHLDTFPIHMNDFSLQLYTRVNSIIRAEERDETNLNCFMDVSDNIAGRIRNNITSFSNYQEFINRIHSKEYTKSRVMRALLHILLDIRKEDYETKLEKCITPYIRILGFKRVSGELLSTLKESSIVPVIAKASDAGRILDDEAMKLYRIDINCANIYEEACAYKYKNIPVHDFAKGIVIV